VREGSALLQGIALCGICGRRLSVRYVGRTSTPVYNCEGTSIANSRTEYCQHVGGARIDAAVADAFLAAMTPAAVEASLLALDKFDADSDAALAQFRRDVERAQYDAQRAERRYRAVDPENRLVARGLETEWERALQGLQSAEKELAARERGKPRALTSDERSSILSLGRDINRVWSSPTTSDRDRKELLRTLLDDVTVKVDRQKDSAHLTLRWKGGLLTDIDVPLRRTRRSVLKTDEDTVELVRRLAALHPDPVIAGILVRQGRKTATGLPFTAHRVASLRGHWSIPCFESKQAVEDGELMSIEAAARVLNMAPSTLHRWVNEGYIAGEQATPTAPWRVRVNDDLRSRLGEKTPDGYVTVREAMRHLGLSRQTILQRVKSGKLKAVHVYRGRIKGLRIQLPTIDRDLFDDAIPPGGAV
jgi:hypothetical protein